MFAAGGGRSSGQISFIRHVEAWRDGGGGLPPEARNFAAARERQVVRAHPFLALSRGHYERKSTHEKETRLLGHIYSSLWPGSRFGQVQASKIQIHRERSRRKFLRNRFCHGLDRMGELVGHDMQRGPAAFLDGSPSTCRDAPCL